ncbi:MAG: AAA family ATPase, partial [Spirochaetales bacterium]|nr:AAA family ATPase [Spirochaetales bacterium]
MSESSESETSFTNNLPVQSTPFFGREAQVAQVAEKLAQSESRLIVLTGPGGSGKTRLGLQIATEMIEEFKDGVFYVPLESITNAQSVIATIAHELGLKERSKKPVGELLKGYLKEKRILLVLDNFEQVTAAAPSVAELLTISTGLKILVTSREILHLQSEYDFPVPPMSLPVQNIEIPPDSDPASFLLQCEAARFFVERATAAQPDFIINSRNGPVIIDICRRLDGLPLALELAAARIRVLPPEDMLERLDKSLSLLTRGGKDRPARQQTLRATIDWSYALLNEDVKKLFRWLSVFSGGLTVKAAEELCRPNSDSDCDVLDDISSLEEKSLLKRQEPLGLPRFAMLETVREYAIERLVESDEADDVRRKHAEYFLKLAAEADSKLFCPDHKAWLNKIDRESNNIRTALDWTLSGGQVELGLKLIVVLGNYWQVGHRIESLYWLEKVLGAGSSPSSELAHVLSIAGHSACDLGDTKKGMSLIEQALSMCRELANA